MEFNLNFKFDNPFKRNIRSFENTKTETTTPVAFDSMSFLKGGYSISLDNAMKFTAVFAAMRLRAESIASLPKMLMENTDKGLIQAKGHPLFKLLKYRPNGFMNIFNFWEYTNACLDGWGNAYVIIFRSSSGIPTELIPIHPSLVDVTFSNRKKWFRVSGSKYYDGVYSDDDMLHFFALSKNGIKGLNPIVYNSDAIKTGISSTKFGNEFFETGGNIKAVLENDKNLQLKDYENFQKNFAQSKNYGTPLLDGGWKYKSVGISPEAAQMLLTRTFAIQDIARIFNVPPHMLAELTRSTFSNIEHQDIQYVKYSMRATVKRYETEMDTKLLFDDEMGIIETKFNLDGLLRGDMTTRSAFYHNAILDGWMSRNEVRAMEHKNKVDGLDEYLYPSNQNITGEQKETTKEAKK